MLQQTLGDTHRSSAGWILGAATAFFISLVVFQTAAQEDTSTAWVASGSASRTGPPSSFSEGSFTIGFGTSRQGSPATSVPPTAGRWQERSGVEEPYVLLYGANSAIMSGSGEDAQRTMRLRGGSKEDLLWFRRAGKDYVIRDLATVEAAKEIFSPQTELGKRQDELGAQQLRLGAEQDKLAAQQAALRAQRQALAAEQLALAERMEGVDESDHRQLERQQNDLTAQMEALLEEQEELSRQQRALGRDQEQLGRLNAEAARKAKHQLRLVLDQAIRSGVAQELR